MLAEQQHEKAGFAFNDADLIGVPYRLIISPKSVANQQIEFKTRDGSQKEMFTIDETIQKILDMVTQARIAARDV